MLAFIRPHILSVILPASNVQRQDDWDETDVIAADRKLGYQIPRLWFAHEHPGGIGEGRPEQWASAHEGAVSAPFVACRSPMHVGI